jgi:putative DNA primase/helicase
MNSINPHIDIFAEFESTLIREGFELDGPVQETFDRPVRCRVNGSRDKPGWYYFHLFNRDDGEAIGYGYYADWRHSPAHTKWRSDKYNHMSSGDRARFEIERNKRVADNERALKQRQDQAAKIARLHIRKAVPATENPYLTRKGIKPHGVYELEGSLIVPLHDAKGEIRSYHRIYPDGTKRFLKGGQTSGLYYQIGKIDQLVYIVEGFATGATVHELTGQAVVAAIGTSGLKPALTELRKIYSGRVVFAADNDRMKTNAGKIAADKAAYGDTLCSVVLPIFPDDSGTDFNDLAAIDPIRAKELLVADPPTYKYQTFEGCLQTLEEGSETEREQAFGAAIEHIKTMPAVAESTAIKRLKNASGVQIGAIRESMKEEKPEREAALTHAQLATKHLELLSIIYEPVGCYGRIWNFDGDAVWTDIEMSEIGLDIGDSHADEPLCRRGSDYKSIATLLYQKAADENFFTDTPAGVVCPEGFYVIENNELLLKPHSMENRARFKLTFDPDPEREPALLLKMLRDAFGEHDPDGQIRMLQQYFGLAVMGLQYETQTAVLLYGAGGSGKGVVQAVLKALLPDSVVSTVSPHEFDSDYSRAVIAGKRLNLCSELDHEKPIPAAQFKAMTGGDPQNGREPYGIPFTFRPTCGVWINSNFYPVTKDRSDGFWRRWAIIYFARGRSAAERNPNLENDILEHEMGAVLAWALHGVKEYLSNCRRVITSTEHENQMRLWKNEANSVAGWLEDLDSNLLRFHKDSSIAVADAYGHYKTWALESGKRPYAKTHFINAMADAGFPQIKRSNMIFTGIEYLPF